MTNRIDEMLDRITAAATGRSDDAGLRLESTYEPAGGPGTLVFPPTYPSEDAKYKVSERFVDGEVHQTVIMDSFQAQANRVEEALQDAVDDGVVQMPYLETAGMVGEHRVRVTSLSAPHRGPDAYFRDSEDEHGTRFDETDVGRQLRLADVRNARAYFTYVPSDLALGFWDSQRGGRGVKLARAYTSEMIGIDPKQGKRGAVRFDPNNITKVPIAFPPKHPEDFQVLTTDDEGKVAKPPKGSKAANPSAAGHGNVPANDANPGVSVSAIQRTAFVSLTALGRLRFPDENGVIDPTVDAAGRAVLACLALTGDRLAFDRASVFLRSGCDLIPLSSSMTWVGRGGAGDAVEISTDESIELLHSAIAKATALGLTWATEPVRLRPRQNLTDLLAASFAAPDAHED